MALVSVAAFTSLPNVGYVKALDLYLFFCAVSAFAGLLLQVVILRHGNRHFRRDDPEHSAAKPAEAPLLPDSSEPSEASSAKLDRCVRVVLPMTFILFNVIFWVLLTVLSAIAWKTVRDKFVFYWFLVNLW